MNMQVVDTKAPPLPRSLSDTGLNTVLMRDILLKTMFRRNLSTITEIAAGICLPAPLTQELVDLAREQKLVEAMGTLHAGGGNEMPFQLSDSGKARALDALSQSEYYGPLPVPLEMFKVQAARQSVRNIKLDHERLKAAMGHLILPEGFLGELGPAVASGRSILMYGPPGNGKSSISNGIRDALGDEIFVPRAVEYAGQIITVYDPIVHTISKNQPTGGSGLRNTANLFDPRYLMCQRPTVITGGELTLDMLDLNYNVTSRTYQASLQMKATGGVFIVDDLGRQTEPPQALINRWIVPMEAEYDILALQSGEKFVVPFDTLVVFSTNFHPNEMFDDAALRRIFFKIKIDGPKQAELLKIFSLVAKAKGMQMDEASLIHLFHKKYPEINNVYANFHAPFLIDQIIAICDYYGEPYHMTPEYVDRAWANLFVDETK